MSESKIKLTKPQLDLLQHIESQPRGCYAGYKPMLKLVELGYASFLKSSLRHGRLSITNGGAEYLKTLETST